MATRALKTKVFFDGGARPNPGPMETAVVVRGEAHVRQAIGTGSNNDAEWLALLHAVEIATALGFDEVEFVGDAMPVVQQASGAWKCRSADLQQHLDAYRAAIAPFAKVRVRHVPRSKNLAGIALAKARIW